ncbi:hypothetical protein P5V15_001036 [Pogonomyrmex californicus]
MDNLKDREKIAKQIAKTSDSIRKKYRALRTGKIDENVALERRFKPIVEPLQQIVKETHPIKKKPMLQRISVLRKKRNVKTAMMTMTMTMTILLLLLTRIRIGRMLND